MGKSKIQWTDTTWNPIRGCSPVSEGCRNCYAARQAVRMHHPGGAYDGLLIPGQGSSAVPTWNGTVRLVPEKLEEPLRCGMIGGGLRDSDKEGETFYLITKVKP